MDFLYTHLIWKPPFPTQSFAGRTVIVTGSNSGIGREAVRHFVRLNADRVIIAVRNLEAGEEAKADIERTTKRTGVAEVWKLDLSSYDSVKAFAARAQRELERLDIAVLNAAVATGKYGNPEGLESHITVNFVSTFMLLILLLPLMRSTAQKLKPGEDQPHMCVVGSGIHHWLKLPPAEYPEGEILARLSRVEAFPNEQGVTKTPANYILSKLLTALVTREIAPAINPNEVIFNHICPGLVKSGLRRELTGALASVADSVARTQEVGSRTLMAGAVAPKESHGKAMSNAKAQPEPARGTDAGFSKFVLSEDGKIMQGRAWRELKAILEREGVDVKAALGPK
ncbi:uncharacterized protein HMPREF1541_01193 [Cyphellophora europaea CBS 101466]|uniref:Uncharacterized protein n=1 Tax=Cyphellophora europaea (strain CBS 101466) TaxID=1220924 RepID=W2SG77_CYPE1|nr:uncharacterized protein HMPREF1541_01193 [Cyphellophora europaea CBS 101466]ETN47003.1 hypothetical protein HMPREF1541_01193 [Cyphellophora europaea CBS 101466]